MTAVETYLERKNALQQALADLDVERADEARKIALAYQIRPSECPIVANELRNQEVKKLIKMYAIQASECKNVEATTGSSAGGRAKGARGSDEDKPSSVPLPDNFPEGFYRDDKTGDEWAYFHKKKGPRPGWTHSLRGMLGDDQFIADYRKRDLTEEERS